MVALQCLCRNSKRGGGAVASLEASTLAEQLKIIGARLLEERQKQGIALETIATKTYIPLRLLKAIEAGRRELLPEPVFIQGFIRRYADALGLDSTAIAQEFLVNLSPVPVASGSQSMTETMPSLPDAATPVQLRPQPEVVTAKAALPRRHRKFELPALPWIGIASVIGLGVLAIMATSPWKPRPETAQTVSPVPRVTPAQSSTKASPAPNTAVTVKMNITDESWVAVRVDGQSVYEGTLTQGTTRSWTGKKQVAVTTGNAGGVSLSYNGGATKAVGAPGEVRTITFPPTRN